MHSATPTGLVSLARCAELLTASGDRIDRSALSRYCDAHALKGKRCGREVLVDYEAVRTHRASNYTRQVMSGGREVPVPARAPERPSAVHRGGGDDPQRELKALQLRRELREEALSEGRLTDTAEVDAAVADAIVDMRAAFVDVRGEIAERLAAELGLPLEKVRTLRAGLKRYDRHARRRFANRMAKTLQQADEEQASAIRRLMFLAAHAVRLRGRG